MIVNIVYYLFMSSVYLYGLHAMYDNFMDILKSKSVTKLIMSFVSYNILFFLCNTNYIMKTMLLMLLMSNIIYVNNSVENKYIELIDEKINNYIDNEKVIKIGDKYFKITTHYLYYLYEFYGKMIDLMINKLSLTSVEQNELFEELKMNELKIRESIADELASKKYMDDNIKNLFDNFSVLMNESMMNINKFKEETIQENENTQNNENNTENNNENNTENNNEDNIENYIQ